MQDPVDRAVGQISQLCNVVDAALLFKERQCAENLDGFQRRIVHESFLKHFLLFKSHICTPTTSYVLNSAVRPAHSKRRQLFWDGCAVACAMS